MVSAAYAAYIAYSKQKQGWAWIFGIMAVLFNPIIPFYLSKGTWQLLDFVSAVIFFASMFNKKELEKTL